MQNIYKRNETSTEFILYFLLQIFLFKLRKLFFSWEDMLKCTPVSVMVALRNASQEEAVK